MNLDAFLQAANKPIIEQFAHQFPNQGRFVRLLSALCHWCPFFRHVDFFPALVYPFIKTIEEDDLISFEVCMSMINHWCQNWFKFYPTEPYAILKIVEEVLEREDEELSFHFRRIGMGGMHYAWPLI